MTIGEALAQCNCGQGGLRYIDEPPGKLRGIGIMCETNNEKQKIVLEFDYNISLFSVDRNWSFDLVKKQKIVNMHLSD